MNLRYDVSTSSDTAVLIKKDQRIELHCKRLEGASFALVMLSGLTHTYPRKYKIQSPFHNIAQARGAMNAIASECERLGFLVSLESTVWDLRVQRELRACRQEREQHQGDYCFDQSDVYFQ